MDSLYLVNHRIMLKGKTPGKVAYIKAHIASRIISGMEKEKPLCEKASTLGSESDEVERIVGCKTSSTSSRELSNIRDSPILTVLHTVVTSLNVKLGAKRERGSSRQLLACEWALCVGKKTARRGPKA